MRRVAIAGTVGMLFVSPTVAQMPGPFEHMAHIVCADPSVAYELLTSPGFRVEPRYLLIRPHLHHFETHSKRSA